MEREVPAYYDSEHDEFHAELEGKDVKGKSLDSLIHGVLREHIDSKVRFVSKKKRSEKLRPISKVEVEHLNKMYDSVSKV